MRSNSTADPAPGSTSSFCAITRDPDVAGPIRLRAFLVDESDDDVSFLICAPTLADARDVLADRRSAKMLTGAVPRIIPVPMRPAERDP